MDTIAMKAYAKINIAIDVLGRRENGYHDLKMIMQTIDLFDTLTFTVEDEDKITITTDMKGLETDENNLVYKAIALMKKEYGITKGVSVSLEKKIPMAAGMAGGSSDCAASLRAMNELFGLKLSDEKLMELGVRLGADVPYCIMGGTALAEGIGEILTKLPPFPECYILVAKPPIEVSTKEIYEALDNRKNPVHPDVGRIIRAIDADRVDGICTYMKNVLEDVTIAKHLEILKIKDLMRTAGAKNAMMTGSGPTVFGIFNEKVLAEDAYDALKRSELASFVELTVPIFDIHA